MDLSAEAQAQRNPAMQAWIAEHGNGLSDAEVAALDREAWLDRRRSGVGGSDAPVLHGQSPYQTEYRLWAEKTGKIKREEVTPESNPLLFWGTELEPAVRSGYSKLTGRAVSAGVTMARHPIVGAMIGSTDGTLIGVAEKPGDGVYEGKTANVFAAAQWKDGIPLYYQIQVQHYLAVTGLLWASLAVFMGGDRQPMRWFDIERSERFIDHHCELVDRWWDLHVARDIPPEPDDSEDTGKVIKLLHPVADGTLVTLAEDFMEKQARLAVIEAEAKALKSEKQQLRNEVMAALGSASYGVLPDGSGWSFQTVNRRGYTKVVQPATFRQLKGASPKTLAKIRNET